MGTQKNLNSEGGRFLQQWDEEMCAMKLALSGYAMPDIILSQKRGGSNEHV